MSIVTLPTGIIFGPECGMGEQRYDRADVAETTGTVDARVGGQPRWVLTLAPSQRLTRLEARHWAALTLKLKGRVNVLAAHNPARSAPQGSMRGTLTLASPVARGAETMTVTGGAGQASKTLLAGDLLQIGTGYGTSQLVMVTDDSTSNGSGSITLQFAHPARYDFPAGTAVTWDKPLAYWRQSNDRTVWTYSGQSLLEQGYGLPDMLEDWPQ